MAAALAGVVVLSLQSPLVATAAEECHPLSTLPCESVPAQLPVELSWSTSHGGLLDAAGLTTGFTLAAPASNRAGDETVSEPDVPGYEPALLSVDNTAGTLTLDPGGGTFQGGAPDGNSQVNAVGVAVPADRKVLELSTTIRPIDFSTVDLGQEAGLWFGLGEDDYASLVVRNGGDAAGDMRVRLLVERNGVTDPAAPADAIVSPVLADDQVVKLRLRIDSRTDEVSAQYALGTGEFQALTSGPTAALAVPPRFTDGAALPSGSAGPVSFGGILASNRGAVDPVDRIRPAFADFTLVEVDVTPPVAPANLTAAAGNAEVTLSWDAVADADTYQVFRSTGATVDTSGAPLAAIPNAAYRDRAVSNGTQYRYVVRAVDAAGNASEASNSVTATPEAEPLLSQQDPVPLAEPDTTPPAPPTDLTATAGNQQVTLSWTGDADSVSYRVHRSTSLPVPTDGVPVATVTASSHTDTGLVNGTRYHYVVVAVDAASNASAPSDPASATPSLCGVAWVGQYYPNRTLSNSPTLTRCDTAIDFTWGAGRPDPSLPANSFSTRWTTTRTFQAGSYRFDLTTNDGMRVFVDGVKVMDAWQNRSADASFSAPVTLTAGEHTVVVEYYENTGNATARFSWQGPNVGCPASTWVGEYFGNRTLSGAPTYRRCDAAVNFAWSGGSPMIGMPSNSFSVRWTTTREFAAGTYRFDAVTNDGMRVLVDGVTVLDAWRNHSVDTAYSATVPVAGGTRTVVVEYYENTNAATARLSWTASDTTPPAPPTGLAAVAGDQQVSLSWTAPPDPDVALYRVFRGGTQVASVTGTTTTDTGLTNGVEVTYTVRAVDTAGNVSEPSAAVSATPVDQTPPGRPVDLVAVPSAADIGLDWSAPADLDVAGYEVYRSTSPNAATTGARIALITATQFTDTTVVPGTDYHYAVITVDQAGLRSSPADVGPVSAGDTLPPSAPAGLSGVAGDEQAILSWTAPPEPDVARYRIYRSTSSPVAIGPGTLQGDVTATSFTQTGLTNGTAYSYVVTAVDAAGNESTPSAEVQVTPADTTPPGVPTTLQAVAGDGRATLTWNASTGDVVRYVVRQDGVIVGGVDAPTTTFEVAGLTNGVAVTFTVSAADEVPNESAPSGPVTVTPIDTTPPAAPGNLAATAGDARVDLSWTAPADPDVTSYRVYRATTSPVAIAPAGLQGGVSGTTYSQTGLTNGTTYYYVVTAVDASGNESPASLEAPAQPQATSAPSIPTGVTATAGDRQVTVAWTASTGSPASYEVSRDGTVVGSVPAPTTTFTDAGLTNGTAYAYRVRALSSAGVASEFSSATSATPTGTLTALPSSVVVSVASGRSASSTVSLTASSGAPTLSVTSDRPWLGATTAPGSVSVTINAGALTPGSYSGQVTVSAPGYSSAVVPVAVTVTQNSVVAENALPGSPASEWDVSGSGDANLQGFATDISADIGGRVDFKIDTTYSNYQIKIYRLGWYGGNGARLVSTVPDAQTTSTNQPNCLTDARGLVDCGNWSVSAGWDIPADAVSGLYLARLERVGGSGASHVPFVVRDDDSRADLLFQTADTTWQAYNRYGGNSLYGGGGPGTGGLSDGRAYAVSYNRPFTTRAYSPEDWIFNAEYPMIRWLERNGYDVAYTTGLDAHRFGATLRQHRVFVSVGHDEYWSGQQRANVEAARDAGVHLAFFSGNEVFWRHRWAPSIDASQTANRTLVTYKETHNYPNNADPSDEWTGTWRDPRDVANSANKPENALTGQLFVVNSGTRALEVPAEDGQLRFWRNSSVAASPGADTLAGGIVGYEWDEDVDNGFRPAGQIRLSETNATGLDIVSPGSHGSSFQSGSATHSLTLHRHPQSGALVFGAGTVQWSWGLDSSHDRGSDPAVPAVQQATVNLFADMGVQPRTLQGTLNPASASPDSTPPTVTITSPTAEDRLQGGSSYTVAGSAADAGAGRVAGVEVSTDGGATWRRATGRTSWTYSFTVPGDVGSAVTIQARATDDSVNTGTPAAVTVPIAVRDCAAAPCSLWEGGVVPPQSPDTGSIELGLRWVPQVNGEVRGVSFYKHADNTGTHFGRLWSLSGDKLAEVQFTNESGSGWQTAQFSQPVSVSAGQTYVVSYYAPNGRYGYTNGYFEQADFSNAPLMAPRSNPPVTQNGVYRYGSCAAGCYPDSTYQASNYWVDVLFQAGDDTTRPTITTRTPAPNSTSARPGDNVVVQFSEAIQVATVNGTTVRLTDGTGQGVDAAVSYDSGTRSAVLDPVQSLTRGATYTVTVLGGVDGIADLAGNRLAATDSWSFSVPEATGCPCTIYGTGTGPGSPTPVSGNDGQAIEVGVRFLSQEDGYVSAVRFFKASARSTTVTGKVYSTSGALLGQGQASFTASASGWQEIPLQSTVPLVANQPYVASVYSGNGDYAKVADAFITALVNDPLVATADAAGAPNGVYRYGEGFPANTWRSTSYMVDVVAGLGASPGDITAPVIVDRTPAAGASNVATSSTVSIAFNESIDPASVTGTNVRISTQEGAVSASAVVAGTTVTLTPTQPLAGRTEHTVTVQGGAGALTDLAGNRVGSTQSWTFTTAADLTASANAGGPVLVVTGTGGFGDYLTEILRAEGLNHFATRRLASLTPSVLADHRTLLLGRTTLSAAQVTMLSDWVQTGGTLVAMRPDPQLAGLLGVIPQGGTLTEGYLQIDTASRPGSGIVAETMQFHGSADLYSTNAGTQTLASLYATANQSAGAPAVTRRPVGSAGGAAIAFAFDLPQSVVLTRQGNPAWVGQNRDNQAGPDRSSDLFYNALSDGLPDWVDPAKIEIPQADEQQRFLANLLLDASKLPLPRFWYLPDGARAAIVDTADEHNSGQVAPRFDAQTAAGPVGCAPQDWTCVRSTNYLYPDYPALDAAQVQAYETQGFEVALHVNTNCQTYDRDQYRLALDAQLADLAARYPGLTPPQTVRDHCLMWSGYTVVPEEQVSRGIRMNTNYYYWPPEWVGDRPALFNGTGFAQRFATLDGAMIDSYLAATQFTDESGQSYPFTVDTLLDRALGPQQYFGAFVGNLHTDRTFSQTLDGQVVQAAQSRGVPVVTARQLLSWTDGRNGSTFQDLTWDGTALGFRVDRASGATGLQAMLPATAAGKRIQAIVGPTGANVPFTLQTIKGVEYAFFAAAAGSHGATYAA
jgi:fibronectin type 3 domain-containing protein